MRMKPPANGGRRSLGKLSPRPWRGYISYHGGFWRAAVGPDGCEHIIGGTVGFSYCRKMAACRSRRATPCATPVYRQSLCARVSVSELRHSLQQKAEHDQPEAELLPPWRRRFLSYMAVIIGAFM
jgi:hypothetical protein